VEIHCTYDPATRGGDAPDGRKVKSTIHWVSAGHALECEARLYDRLLAAEPAGESESEEEEESPKAKDFLSQLNPKSLEAVPAARIEPSVQGAQPGALYQFERLGYFCVDPDSTSAKQVFNRTVQLRDSWAKIEQKLRQPA